MVFFFLVYPFRLLFFSFKESKNYCSNLRSDFLIKKSCLCSYVYFFWRAPAYQFICWVFDFSLTFSILARKFFSCCFSFLCFASIIFFFACILGYKKPPSTLRKPYFNNQFYKTHKRKSTMDRFLSILEEKQPVPEEIVDEEKLRFIASKISIGIFLAYLKLTTWYFLRMKNRECSRTTIRN